MRRIVMLIMAMLLMSAAHAEETEATTPPIGIDFSQLRQGGEVSGAYVDPSATPAPAQGKATGYAYDRSALVYTLVFSDEFDTPGAPDPQKWGYDLGGGGFGNNELQYYTDSGNAFVEDGCLVIETRKEAMGIREYTSARLVTRGKADFLYGKIEVCAKLPSGVGTWPAIWMLPTDWRYGAWPASGEIDVMEHVGYDQDIVHASVHTQAFNHLKGTQKSGRVRARGASEDFHVYAVEWLPDMLIFSMDGNEYFTYRPAAYTESPTEAEWPFDKRMHLLINVAFGGNWGGARGVDEACLPQRMLVDYVRVYQSDEITALTAQ